MEIHGTYADAFRPVRDRFEQNFLDGLEAGASVAVTDEGTMTPLSAATPTAAGCRPPASATESRRGSCAGST